MPKGFQDLRMVTVEDELTTRAIRDLVLRERDRILNRLGDSSRPQGGELTETPDSEMIEVIKRLAGRVDVLYCEYVENVPLRNEAVVCYLDQGATILEFFYHKRPNVWLRYCFILCMNKKGVAQWQLREAYRQRNG